MGCGFVLTTCAWIFLLLAINCALVSRFGVSLTKYAPEFIRRDKIVQMALFVSPVVMLFVEWWLLDLIVDKLFFRNKASATRQNEFS